MTELQTLIFYIVLCLAPFLFLIMYEFYQMYRYDKELKRIIEELKDYYDQWPGFTEGEQALYQEQTYEIKVDDKTETVHDSALTKLSN